MGDALSREVALCWQLRSEPALLLLLLPKTQQGKRGKAQESSRPHRELLEFASPLPQAKILLHLLPSVLVKISQ